MFKNFLYQIGSFRVVPNFSFLNYSVVPKVLYTYHTLLNQGKVRTYLIDTTPLHFGEVLFSQEGATGFIPRPSFSLLNFNAGDVCLLKH